MWSVRAAGKRLRLTEIIGLCFCRVIKPNRLFRIENHLMRKFRLGKIQLTGIPRLRRFDAENRVNFKILRLQNDGDLEAQQENEYQQKSRQDELLVMFLQQVHINSAFPLVLLLNAL